MTPDPSERSGSSGSQSPVTPPSAAPPSATLSSELALLLEPIRTLHERIRDAVVQAGEQVQADALASVVDDRDDEGDTIYAVDRVSEEVLVRFFETEIAPRWPIVLIAEGLHGGSIALPRGIAEADARWRIIVDPIDGTRGLMYQKRSGWILTGVAPNRGPATSLIALERFSRIFGLRPLERENRRVDKSAVGTLAKVR